MKAITLWQPWAGAMAAGFKRVETRDWRLHHRGDICIHAAMRKMTENDWLCVPHDIRCGGDPEKVRLMGLRRGILAVVEVYDCVPAASLVGPNDVFQQVSSDVQQIDHEYLLGDFSAGRYAILTRNLRTLRNPVACKGMQGIWTVPGDIERMVKEQLP